MLDLLFLGATLGFFAATGALLRLCERLMPSPPAPLAPPPAAPRDPFRERLLETGTPDLDF